MPKLPLLTLSRLADVGQLAAAPALAGEAPPPAPVPSDAPPLCSANPSPAPAVGTPAPQPASLFPCSVCSDTLCLNKTLGDRCGAGPAFHGFRCYDYGVCSEDGHFICICAIA